MSCTEGIVTADDDCGSVIIVYICGVMAMVMMMTVMMVVVMHMW